ncbi:MAG: 1,6-anhydro-N-acetylmuramyl-L-alanine amidase AmpD [Zhongshania sp.]|uniref:1,6-anhydro-N-acetylmuramyl-L-alanine amidase AmpD n=1 Tax=Zhongshania sp. TaxID=1971902 RepID=UPI00262F30CF|nr:1,6-anhydro-N-acetylmuramyl-L-alanine amidase AmpD [Zhongshania sp.]MDF1692973.1 1,6-anhydro-N-acetylmuramyl-L-alanine amidase AmpD [Zhongshania sp.]
MYTINSAGWLNPAAKHPSPNFNDRPVLGDISLLVIHNISLPAGQFGGRHVHELFTNCLDCNTHPSFDDLQGLKVSSHLFIDRRGGVSQFVSFADRAWHAGVSQFAGRENCNDFSIGIELEGCDDIPYTYAQYRELIALSHTLRRAYPAITPERIVGHNDIAPGRKTDPGAAFDWTYYKNALE